MPPFIHKRFRSQMILNKRDGLNQGGTEKKNQTDGEQDGDEREKRQSQKVVHNGNSKE